MSYLKERVAYLQGLAEGMQISDSTNEGKLIKAILEVLDDFALAVDDIEEVQEQLSEQVDNIDEDLAEVERVTFDMDDDDDDVLLFKEITCPNCHEEFELDPDLIDSEDNSVECPNCHESFDLSDVCTCEECEDGKHD